MREDLLREPYSCTPICRIRIVLERLTEAVGPVGDTVCFPMRIVKGSVSGIGLEKRVAGGSDFALMYADEKLVHDGVFVATGPTGDLVVWYEGTSQAEEGAYDALLDGESLTHLPTRISVRTSSTSLEWKELNRRPLLGVGSFDGSSGTLDVTVLSVTEGGARKQGERNSI